MSDIDALVVFDGTAITEPAHTGADGRLCRNHHYVRSYVDGVLVGKACDHCGRQRDEVAARRNRGNRTRGDRHELAVSRTYGGRKIGKLGGPVDVEGSWAKAQVKSHTGGVPARLADPFAKLATVMDRRVPLLIERYTRQGAEPVDFVILRGSDFRDLLGALDKPEDPA